jgi:hypothetical protein
MSIARAAALSATVFFSIPSLSEAQVTTEVGTVSYLNGSELWETCNANSQRPDPRFCKVYITGVIDAERTEADAGGLQVFCMPNIVADAAKDIVVGYLVAHPERRADGAAGLVLVSLREAFPCHR